MTPFQAYEMLLALKRHFTSSYDYVKYHGKVKTSIKTFEKLNLQHFYKKLADMSDPEKFSVANLIINPKIFIVELVSSKQCEESYTRWLNRQQSLTYLFKEEIEKIDFSTYFNVNDHQLPLIFKAYLGNRVSIETLLILLESLKLNDFYKEQIHDPTYHSISFKIKKYRPFITYDEPNITKLINDNI